MQEIQRFNKVLKSCVLFGDIILLNSLLWGFELVLGSRFYSGNLTSLYQGMVLLSLCYLVCNIQSGVILHHPVVRPEQIMIRVLRNMVPFILFSICFLSLFHFEFFRSRLFGLFYVALLIILICYRLAFRYFWSFIVKRRKCSHGCIGGQSREYAGTLPFNDR